VVPTAAPSSTESPAPTASSDKLTGILAGRTDLETWTPGSDAEAQDTIASVAAFCQDYCPAKMACVEDDCRLFRLESRADMVIRHTPAESVGVLGQPITGL
jgi:hypothetical protein